jgi:hypothetical protein
MWKRLLVPVTVVAAMLTATIPASARGKSGITPYDWVVQYGTSFNDETRAVAVDPTGDVIVAGITLDGAPGRVSSSRDGFVRKYRPSTTGALLLWHQRFGTLADDVVFDVAVDQNRNVYVVGQTMGALGAQLAGYSDAFVRSYDPAGVVRWTRQFTSEEAVEEGARGVAVGPSRLVRVVGALGSDAFLRTFSGDDGSVVGEDRFPYGPDARAFRVAASGTATAEQVFVAGGAAAGTFVRRYDNGRAPVTTFLGLGSDVLSPYALDVAAGRDSVYLASFIDRPGGQRDAYVVRLDPVGLTEVWADATRTAGDDAALGVAIDTDGRARVVGSMGGDAFVRTYGPASATPLSVARFGTASGDEAAGAAVHGAALYVAGTTWGKFGGTTGKTGQDGFLARFGI